MSNKTDKIEATLDILHNCANSLADIIEVMNTTLDVLMREEDGDEPDSTEDSEMEDK